MFPALKGDPGTGVKNPVCWSMLKAKTSPEPRPEQSAAQSATYRKRPSGSIVTHPGPDPVANGDPLIGLNAPLVSIRKPDTAFDNTSATYRKFPAGSAITEFGACPPAN